MFPLINVAHLLPHCPPFRLIDRVTAADLDQGTLCAERLIASDDPLIGAGTEVLPGTLVMEALCQAAACLNGLFGLRADPSRQAQPQRGYLVAVSDFRFHDAAWVGETLSLRVVRQGEAGRATAFSAEASAAARPIASGRLLFAVTAQ